MGMLQVIKESSSSWLAAALRLPGKSVAALRYSFMSEDDILSELSEDGAAEMVATAPSEKDISFTFAVISLAAQVAKADGKVSKEEYLAFRDSFPLNGGICRKIRQLFILACENETPFLHHAVQIKKLFPQKKSLFFSLVERLFRIATADGELSKEQEKILARVAHQLDLSPAEYGMLYDKYSRPLPPHDVLEVKRRSPREVIKKSYHRLMRRYHPDRFAGEQTSTEVKMILTLKSSEITKAYNTLSKKAA